MKTKIVYLLHFNRPYKHAKHYLGSTRNLDQRISEHLNGHGARLLEVLVLNNISFQLVRTWKGDKKLERKLKNMKCSPKLCPICNGHK